MPRPSERSRPGPEERLYRRLVASRREGALLVRRGRIVWANAAFTRLAHTSLRKVAGQRLIDVLADRDGKRGQTLLANGSKPAHLTVAVGAGRRTEVEASATALRLDGHRAIALTVRRSGPAPRSDATHQEALTLEHLWDAVVRMDLEGRIVDWNPAAERLFGYARADVLGRPASILTQTDAETGATGSLEEDIVAHLRSQGHWSGELRFVRPDGSVGICETIVVPVRDESGRARSTLAVNRDVSERRHLEMQLRQSQKMEAVGRLAGGIAHDFNNLLNVIGGYSEILGRRLGADHPLRRHAQEINKASDRAASLVRQLLAFSRKQVLQPRTLDLNAVVHDMEEMLHRLLGERLILWTRLAPDLRAIRADPTQIEQVILNLTLNARDAMPEGGELTLETSNCHLRESHGETPAGSYVVLMVSDTGAGMDPSTLARIFEPFFTTKEPGRGTGLGLATVYGIVKQSGGSIHVDSERQRGTRFTLYFPEAVPTAHPAVAHVTPPPSRELRPGAGTVLLVEDEAALRALAREALEASGYVVLEAADGAGALEIAAARRGPIDVLVTDVVMPRLGGRELSDRLGRWHPETRTLFVSGHAEEMVGGALDDGKGFLEKPFTLDALVAALQRIHPPRAVIGRERG